MPKIISGGLKGIKAPQLKQQQEDTEGYGEFLLRNIAKTPANIYKNARTGFGIGNLLNIPIARAQRLEQEQPISDEDPYKGVYDYLKNYRSGIQTALGVGDQAQKESEALFPKYMAESKPEDWLMELATGELPFVYASGGLSSLKNLGKFAKTSAGIYGGSQLGANLGQEIGQSIGEPEIGQALGAIGGGHLGGLVTHKLRPTKVLPPLQQITENGIKTEIQNYKNNIKNLESVQKSSYTNATTLEGKSKGPANNIKNTLRSIEDDLLKGVSKADRALVIDNIYSLESHIRNNTLSLKDAKQFQKNFNDQIYNRNVSNSFKRQMIKVTSSLNDFIKETGSPEHFEQWQKAEQTTKDLKNLKYNEREFIKQKNQEIKDSRKLEKESEYLLRNVAHQGLNKYGAAGLSAAVGFMKGGFKGSVLAGLAGKIASSARKEYKYAKEVFKNHPELQTEYANTLKSATKKDIPRVINNLNRLGDHIEQLYDQETHKAENTSKKGSFKIVKGGLKA